MRGSRGQFGFSARRETRNGSFSTNARHRPVPGRFRGHGPVAGAKCLPRRPDHSRAARVPKGNTRTSEPFVTRIYKTDDADQILKPQPNGYPFTVTDDYTLKEDEAPGSTRGWTSRPDRRVVRRRSPWTSRWGVHGLVVRAGGGPWGTIAVQLRDGTVIQDPHTMASHVKVGDVVAPNTPLGITGRTEAGVIHLHVQGDRFNNPGFSARPGVSRRAEEVGRPGQAGGGCRGRLRSRPVHGAKPNVGGRVVKPRPERRRSGSSR